MRSWLGTHPVAVAWQDTDLHALGLTAEECKAAVRFVDADLRVSAGSDAAARVLIVAGFPWSAAGWLMLAPGIRTVAQAAYRWVAANRHRFKGDPIAP